MGYSYMDLAGGGFDQINLNHQECTYHGCRVWGSGIRNGKYKIILRSRCLFMGQVGNTNSPTETPTRLPTANPTHAPTLKPDEGTYVLTGANGGLNGDNGGTATDGVYKPSGLRNGKTLFKNENECVLSWEIPSDWGAKNMGGSKHAWTIGCKGHHRFWINSVSNRPPLSQAWNLRRGTFSGASKPVLNDIRAVPAVRPSYIGSLTNPTTHPYVYSSRLEATNACITAGFKGLCSKAEVDGFQRCAAGWMTDYKGYWMSKTVSGCGSGKGFRSWGNSKVGAYCCHIRTTWMAHVTAEPTVSPTRRPTRIPTRYPTRYPTKVPTRAPTRYPTRNPTPPPVVIDGSAARGGASTWSPYSNCPAGYVAIGPAHIDILESYRHGRHHAVKQDVNHWECTMTGCRTWNTPSTETVVKARCLKTSPSNVVDAPLITTRRDGWSAWSVCPTGFVAASLVHMDLLEHTRVHGAFDLNHWECSKSGCRTWIQHAQARIRTRCVRGNANTIIDGNTVRGGRNTWSHYSSCPAGSYALGIGYMDLLGSAHNHQNNHQECTSRGCRIWGITTGHSDIVLRSRCIYHSRIGYTNAPTRYPTRFPTRYPTRVPTRTPTSTPFRAWWTPYRGGGGGGPLTTTCHRGRHIDYWSIRTGSLVDRIQARCNDGRWLSACGGGGGGAAAFWAPSRRFAYIRTGALVDQIWGRGGRGGGHHTLNCGSGKISGYHARCGSLVDGLKFYCTEMGKDTSVKMLGGTAYQSSEGWSGRPSRAIDGRTDQNYGRGTCTHTGHQYHAWWKLQLPKTHMISYVKVWNRNDCCRHRLHGTTVKVAGRTCGTLNSGTHVQTISCHNQPSNYVLIQEPRRDYLTLCEVQVFGTHSTGCDANMRFTSASQHGNTNGHNQHHYGAHRAIDGSAGSRQGIVGNWIGDLGGVKTLTALTIQWEACQCSRRGSIVIDVSNDKRHWRRFASEGGWHQWGGRVTRTVHGVKGTARYVRISGVHHLMQNNWMSMWEVTPKGC